jgi:hypothetical protein
MLSIDVCVVFLWLESVSLSSITNTHLNQTQTHSVCVTQWKCISSSWSLPRAKYGAELDAKLRELHALQAAWALEVPVTLRAPRRQGRAGTAAAAAAAAAAGGDASAGTAWHTTLPATSSNAY